MEIIVDIHTQRLWLLNARQVQFIAPISSAKKGVGQKKGSYQTPLGRHQVAGKIGAGCLPGTAFKSRHPTGVIFDPAVHDPKEKDWILTRILWLEGLEPGVNKLGNVDSKRRYIYIHGTPDSEPMGIQKSHGCIRLRNHDIVTLFEQVSVGTPVTILDSWDFNHVEL